MLDRRTAFGLIIAFAVFAGVAPGAWGAKFSDASLVPQKGTVGAPCRFQLNGRMWAGMAPHAYEKQSGELPPGLRMSKRGLILGRPTTAGEFQFWCDTFDAKDPAHSRHSQRLIRITIEPAPTKEIQPAAGWEKPGWTLVYGDEFDGRNLDGGRKLDDVHWVPAYQGTMPAGFSVENGALHVRIGRDLPPAQTMPLARPDKPGRVSSVETQWRFMQQYGLFEIRARMPRGSGAMAALWLSPGLAFEKLKGDGGKRESANEAIDIDIFKYLGKDPKAGIVAAHYGRRVGEAADSRKVDLAFDPSDDFHVYGLQWDAEALVWTVDGKEVYRSDKVPHTPMFIRLSAFEDAAAYGAIDASVVYPKDLEVDYVRVFERELGGRQ
jgi:hypothetical protein